MTALVTGEAACEDRPIPAFVIGELFWRSRIVIWIFSPTQILKRDSLVWVQITATQTGSSTPPTKKEAKKLRTGYGIQTCFDLPPRDVAPQNIMTDYKSTAFPKKRPAAEECGPVPASAAPGQNKPKRVKRKHIDPVVLEFRKEIQMSCKDDDLGRALEAYYKAKKNRTQINASTYYSLLSLCGGLNERSLHVGVPRESARPKKPTALDDGTEKDKANGSDRKDDEDLKPKVQPKDDEHGSTEPLRAKKEIPLEERKRIAFEIKAEMDKAKLPLSEAAYTPVIRLYSKAGDLEQANAFLLEAEKVQQCKPKLRLYSSLLQAYAEAGKVLDALRVWHMLTQQNLMVSEKEYVALMRCAVLCQSVTLMESVLADLAEDVPVPSRDATNAIIDWFESTAAVDTMTKPNTDEADIASWLEKIHQPQEKDTFHTIPPAMGPVHSSTGWTISRDCTVDTSNGSLTSGCLQGESLSAIELTPETWEFMEQGKSVLLVMHSRHFASKLLPPKFKPLVDKWMKNEVLYQTPHGMDDDWFWMHIALTRPGTLMVTNDQLRDHCFQFMLPRCFLRWRERHQVRYDFGEVGDRQVRFTFPDPYSRRIQRLADGLVVPLPKRGDENRFLDGCFAADEGVSEAETYLCIRPMG
eukprot:scaffold12232_cov149-Amphora_coffeaeformis.AAC.6